MPKNKVSEWSATAANNTDIGGINIAEGCAPSGINNAIRELMAQVKDMQSGTDADNFAIGGTLSVTGNTTLSNTLTVNSSVGTAGQILTSRGAGLSPQWTTGFVAGMIMMWSGTIATIPSGWVLCDGSNSTPDLRNRFIIGANADDGGAAKTNVTGSATQTGGSKDSIVVSHTHTATDAGHTHTGVAKVQTTFGYAGGGSVYGAVFQSNQTSDSGTASISVSTTGSSGTNANLPPYYALAYIMKS
jgi:microcystin-dependent protein